MNIKKTNFGNTIFHILIAKNDFNTFKSEIKKYEDFDYVFKNSFDSIKNSLLHKSVFNGNYEISNFLILNNHSINLTNIHGQTPLHLAYINNFDNLIKLLIESGSNIDIKDNNNLKPKELENTI